ETFYQEALAMRKELLGDRHPQVARTLNYLAELYLRQGRNELAEPLLQEALAIAEEGFRADHPLNAKIRKNLKSIERSSPE
ncbi:tetratricopeptide repeat protein, partial [Arcanobacterium phocae]